MFIVFILAFSFFFELHAHGDCVPCWYACLYSKQCLSLLLMVLFLIHPRRTDVCFNVGCSKRCCCRTRRLYDTRYALTIYLVGHRIKRHIRGTCLQQRATSQQKKKTRDTCIQQCTRYTFASDGHVGRSRVRNPAPLYFFSCFMFLFFCATPTRYARTIKGNIPTKKKQKTRDTCIHRCTPLAADGRVGVGFSVGW